MTQVSLFSGGIALCFLPFVKVPAAEVWPWLSASAAIHTFYRFMLIGAYRAGDMAQVYPIMRGAAPLMTVLATALLVGERVSALGMATVAALSLGVFLMSFRGGRVGGFDGRAVAMALLSAASTCGYTLADGIGARVNGSGPGYALWMFVLNAVTMQSIALAVRGWKSYDGLRAHWSIVASGGAMSMCAYFIVIWAMTQAPIALVAALRETSVLFGSLIAMVILKEVIDRLAGAGVGVCAIRHGALKDGLNSMHMAATSVRVGSANSFIGSAADGHLRLLIAAPRSFAGKSLRHRKTERRQRPSASAA